MRIFVMLLTLFLLQSCSKTEKEVTTLENFHFNCVDSLDKDVLTNDCKQNWTCSFKKKNNSKINSNQSIVSGNNIVFIMNNWTDGLPHIADDEVISELIFEVDESQSSFSVNGSDISDLNVHYGNMCFCTNIGLNPVLSGCMQGEKQTDGSWLIQGNIVVPKTAVPINFSFDLTFR